MEKEAELTAHTTVLSSCQAIVDKLRQEGPNHESKGKDGA